MNRDKAYREAVYQAIKNIQINVDGDIIQVPVYDSKLESDDPIYVIFESQTAQVDHNFTLLMWRCNIDLSIYHRQQDSATFDIVDLVSEAIENAILVSPGVGNFSSQVGWQINNTYLQSANSLKLEDYKNNAGTLVNKILQISSHLLKL